MITVEFNPDRESKTFYYDDEQTRNIRFPRLARS